MEDFIKGIPKCELHMHICGNTEPELVFKIAERNHVKIQYESAEQLRKAYHFSCLQEFLDILKLCSSVVKKPQDLYDITYDYLEKAHSDNVKYCELYFTPQSFKPDMTFDEATEAVVNACKNGEKELGIKSRLILCQQRYQPESSTIEVLHELLKCPFKDYYVAVGLANAELPYPPKLFVNMFQEAKASGFKITIHAGEEGPSDYIKQAIELCNADRIDHGNSAQDDQSVVSMLRERKIPLTMCPLSNLRLKVINDLKEHPIKKFLENGLLVTINSDDPAFFDGYLNKNFIETQKELDLSKEHIIQLAKNSFISSFLSEEEKQKGIMEIDNYVKSFAG
ncbi:adenosine deaminase [Histomonas meleagridis]|uniref:adenosine deaminase n=1 Tax=Histomonas meleagridis TaxID=135588 RepID=UPI00355A5976|nr:adenosine deaminase [Histomonas meleagridis]KAH0796994.1 adenosine deaminase [Histomonas meleagridis]